MLAIKDLIWTKGAPAAAGDTKARIPIIQRIRPEEPVGNGLLDEHLFERSGRCDRGRA
jgi:hypothetical protein